MMFYYFTKFSCDKSLEFTKTNFVKENSLANNKNEVKTMSAKNNRSNNLQDKNNPTSCHKKNQAQNKKQNPNAQNQFNENDCR